MSKVEGHAEGERGSEGVFVQARSYGNLIKRQTWKCLVYPFMTFFCFVRIDVIARFNSVHARAKSQTQRATIHEIIIWIHASRLKTVSGNGALNH